MQTIQSVRRVHRKPGQTTGRGNPKKTQSQKLTTFPAAHGFLNQTFAPVTDCAHFSTTSYTAIQSTFYASLNNLSRLYKFPHFTASGAIFPYNIYQSFTHAEKWMQEKTKYLRLLIIEQDNNPACLATLKELDTGMTLYYLPLDILVGLHRGGRKQCFQMVLSIFAYLHRIAGMPLCSDNDYLYYCYEMIENWVDDACNEFDEEEYRKYSQDLSIMRRFTNVLEKAVRLPLHLDSFGERVKGFSPSNQNEGALLVTAEKLYALYQQYPTSYFNENILPKQANDNEERPIYANQYLSFCWTMQGWINDHLFEIVNCDLQERCEIKQPSSLQFFDEPQTKESHDLDFETRLLDYICELSDALNDL